MSDRQSAADSCLGSLVDRLLDQLILGDAAGIDAIFAKYPEQAETLRRLQPTLEYLAELRNGSASECAAARSPETFKAPPSHSRDADVQRLGLLGDFQILREIGRGGMGVVYEAEQISLQRRVALKMLPLAGLLDERAIQRFRNEAQAAAGLHHPHIVPIFAVGCERGMHFYAMQFVEGPSIDRVLAALRSTRKHSVWSNESDLTRIANNASPPLALASERSTRAAAGDGTRPADVLSTWPVRDKQAIFRRIAELGIQASEALQYAHEWGVIHRDIKPANLLLDARGNLWIADFGLARIDSANGDITLTGDFLGTLRYMSPEQLTGNRLGVDHRTDIYSLGVTLYELLTLKPLCDAEDRLAIMNQIADADPRPLRAHDPDIPLDLQTIVLKAVAKSPAERYATAKDLAEDLHRHLTNRPLCSRPPTPFERARKWMRRHPAVVRSFLVVLVIASLVSALSATLILNERAKASSARLDYERDTAFRMASEEAHRRVSDLLGYTSNIQEAERCLRRGDDFEAEAHLDACIPSPEQEDHRGFEWYYLREFLVHTQLTEIGRHRGVARCARISPDRKLLATGGTDGTRIWELDTLRPIRHLTSQLGEITDVAWDPQGRWLVTTSSALSAVVWSVDSWQPLHVLLHSGEAVSAAFTPDGSQLLTGQKFGEVAGFRITPNLLAFWDTNTWTRRADRVHHGDWFRDIAISSDGQFAASVASREPPYLWKLPGGQLQQRLENLNVPVSADPSCVAFAHRRNWVAVGEANGALNVWDLDDGTFMARHQGMFASNVEFSDDDRWLACTDWPKVCVLPVTSQGISREYVYWINTGVRVRDIKFLDDQRLLVLTEKGSISTWNFREVPGESRVSVSALPLPGGVAYWNHSLVVADGQLRVRKADQPQQESELPILADLVAISGDEKSAATGMDGSRRVQLWKLPEWTLLREVDTGLELGKQSRLYLWPDQMIVEHTPFLRWHFNVADGSSQRADSASYAATYSLGRSRLLCRNGLGGVDLQHDGKYTWRNDRGDLIAADISADERRFAIAYPNATIEVRWIERPRDRVLCLAESGDVANLCLSPNGSTLAAVVQPSNKLILWNAETGHQLLSVAINLVYVTHLFFSNEGKSLVVAGSDADGQSEIVILGPKKLDAAFSDKESARDDVTNAKHPAE